MRDNKVCCIVRTLDLRPRSSIIIGSVWEWTRQTLRESISVGTALQIGNRRISSMLFACADDWNATGQKRWLQGR